MPLLTNEQATTLINYTSREIKRITPRDDIAQLNELLLKAFPLFSFHLMKDGDVVMARETLLRVAGLRVPVAALKPESQAAFIEYLKTKLPTDAAVLLTHGPFPAFVPYTMQALGYFEPTVRGGHCGYIAFVSSVFAWIPSSYDYPPIDIVFPDTF